MKKTAKQIADAIKKNAHAFWESRITYDTFNGRAVRLWKIAESQNVVREVTRIVAPKLS